MQDHPDTGSDIQPAERGVGTDSDTVKVYASDTGHPAQGAGGSGNHRDGRLAGMGEHCRERIAARPWTAMCTATVVAGVIGALAGYCCGKRHGRWL
jgi:ABC-type branched-subunit amino acid transport system permease subunit